MSTFKYLMVASSDKQRCGARVAAFDGSASWEDHHSVVFKVAFGQILTVSREGILCGLCMDANNII
jgi:hypothetical protein